MNEFSEAAVILAYETAMRWRERREAMPFTQFPRAWMVRVLPPEGGMLIRYEVRRKDYPMEGVGVAIDLKAKADGEWVVEWRRRTMRFPLRDEKGMYYEVKHALAVLAEGLHGHIEERT